jgi:glycosyltransferase involved in cell wall biosynthesis
MDKNLFMKLSVIVPVYNVAEYLYTCINSIAKQDLGAEYYEIIAVNDGSTDNSLNKLQALQKKHENLKIITQQNQGLSGARNTGLNTARGEYILFVDADDYILPNVLLNLHDLARKNKTDIIEFGAIGITPENKTVYTVKATTNNKVMSGEEYLSSISYMSSACNKLYSLCFLNEHKLRFMPDVYIEDIEFNSRAVFLSKRIMAIETIIAHFLQREGSITRTRNFEKKEKMIYDVFTVLSSINNFTENNVPKASKAYIPLKRRVSSLTATLLLRVLTNCRSPQVKNEIINNLKKQKLYPTQFKGETRDKQWFMLFANNYMLFSAISVVFNLKNRRYDGK